MVELELCYLFEGKDHDGMAKISRDKLVIDLQEEIHQGWNNPIAKMLPSVTWSF